MGLFDKKNDEAIDPINDVEVTVEQEDGTVISGDEANEESIGTATPKVMTEGQKRNAKFRASLEAIIKFAVDNKAPEDVIAAAKFVRPSYFGISAPRGPGFTKAEFTASQNKIMAVFGVDSIDALSVGQTADEMAVFQKIKAGRREMHIITNELIKIPGTKGRVWISFNSDTGIYTVAGKGDAAPEGWTGYMPSVKGAAQA